MNAIDTITEAPIDSFPRTWTDAAPVREHFLQPGSQADSAWRGRPNALARPHRVRRNRQSHKQLSSRGSVRRQTAAGGGPVTDETLLASLRDGNISAGDALIARHAGPLLRYLQRLAGPDLAEELHQQTWLSVLDHVGRFQSGDGNTAPGNGGGFKAWLFRIATNKVNDVWRSRGRERNAKEGLRCILDPRAPHAGTQAEALEQNQRLSAALDLLPREQREALVLRFYSSMKFTEIARVMGCPVNTALTRVHKGILKLRQLMQPE